MRLFVTVLLMSCFYVNASNAREPSQVYSQEQLEQKKDQTVAFTEKFAYFLDKGVLFERDLETKQDQVVKEDENLKAIVRLKNAIAILSESGSVTLYLKGQRREWMNVASEVASVEVDQDRLVMLGKDSSLSLYECEGSEFTVHVSTHLVPHRIGKVTTFTTRTSVRINGQFSQTGISGVQAIKTGVTAPEKDESNPEGLSFLSKEGSVKNYIKDYRLTPETKAVSFSHESAIHDLSVDFVRRGKYPISYVWISKGPGDYYATVQYEINKIGFNNSPVYKVPYVVLKKGISMEEYSNEKWVEFLNTVIKPQGQGKWQAREFYK